MKKHYGLIIAAILFFAAAAAVYFAPVSERALTVPQSYTSSVINTETLYTTRHVTSMVQEASTFTTVTVLESPTTILDKPYLVGPTGSEFTYLRIKDLKIGDRVSLEIDYPYKIWVKVVDPKGKTVFEDIYQGGLLKEYVKVETEGVHTLNIETLAAPGRFILRVKVIVFHLTSSTQITEHTYEKEVVHAQTSMTVLKSTQTTTIESHYTTLTKTTLQSRGAITPALIIIGIIMIVSGLIASRRTKKKERAVYCTKCGRQVDPKDEFCSYCGEKKVT